MAPLKYNDNGPFSMDKDCVVFPAHAASAADLAARSDTHEVVVFVATHGNEHCGVRAVEQLYGEGYFSKVGVSSMKRVLVHYSILNLPSTSLLFPPFLSLSLSLALSLSAALFRIFRKTPGLPSL
eukprot:TRINITY_DN4636_c0_g2_i1.p1 TRINITY_DN4636_c0_g2~~TRINITY_DN4636_c0_g2_i1.p1  ORF type:complete len:125 (+),score=16.59 TRINITY_DN4636_c0_g2_i1:129-503(+)